MNTTPATQGDRTKTSTWDERFALLAAYKEDHGHVDLPRSFNVDGVALPAWLQQQKFHHGKGELSAERVTRLEDAGVTWSTPRTPWDDALAILAAYREAYGDANAPDKLIFNGFPLGTWLQTQRREYRAGKANPERVAKLEALGVVWDFKAACWERNFALVAALIQCLGTAEIPYAERPLWKWLNAQQAKAKNGTLATERRQRLEALGVRFTTGSKA